MSVKIIFTHYKMFYLAAFAIVQILTSLTISSLKYLFNTITWNTF